MLCQMHYSFVEGVGARKAKQYLNKIYHAISAGRAHPTRFDTVEVTLHFFIFIPYIN